MGSPEVVRPTAHTKLLPRVLDRWAFAVAPGGMLTILPLAKRVSRQAVLDLTRWIRVVRDDRFPRVVIMDLLDVGMSDAEALDLARPVRRLASELRTVAWMCKPYRRGGPLLMLPRVLLGPIEHELMIG